MIEPLCTAIEPVTRAMMCQRSQHHRGRHRSVAPADGGIVTVEWQNTSVMCRLMDVA